MAATVHTPPFENYFSYLRDARLRGAIAEVVLGDARLQMRSQIEQDEEEKFDVLVVDAFSSDSIPLHLLTKECFLIYDAHLERRGVLAFHISSRFFDLSPVIFGLAREADT